MQPTMPKGKRKAQPPEPPSSEQQQAQAEGLVLRVADNKTGYVGVSISCPGQTKPYLAQLSRGGKKVYLGRFATAEEAALCIARSLEGQEAAERAAAPLTSDQARQQAQAERLTLRVADSTTRYYGKTGYHGVRLDQRGKTKPYQARVCRAGTTVSLGYFATAEEAALCVARTPEGRAAAERLAAALTSEDARQQAQAEGLMLIKSDNNKTGYFGVSFNQRPGLLKRYQARVCRGRKNVSLGCFATAEEAALCVAQSPEGQALAEALAKAEALAEALAEAEAEALAEAEAEAEVEAGALAEVLAQALAEALAEAQRIQNESDPLDSLCSWAFQLCTLG
eukprot:scaffold46485_cov67-Phaeocystis_antarctica.AAC.3